MRISDDKFLRLPQVKAKTGLCRATIYNYMRDGMFPKQIILGKPKQSSTKNPKRKSKPEGKRCVAWLESEINAWMEQCVQNSRQEK